jgi:fatty-acid desaturase
MGGSVPLSEHEQRQLEQIEQALYADYPRFANAVRASDPRVHYKRRVVEATLGFVLGIGMLLGGVISKYIWVAVAGFVVMLACAMWALNSYRHMTGTAVGKGQPRQKDRKNARSAKVSMMERLEERWRRRQERER